ncbi:MAG TPA: glycosyltransferase [Blastocatellia bacterium]|nr:glycosyltransferase [Blastocatellia bacterium]
MSQAWIKNRKALIVAPTFHAWDLGAYLAKELVQRMAAVRCLATHSIPEQTLQRRLIDECADFRPDLLFTFKLDQVRPATLKRIRDLETRVILWSPDCFGPDAPEWLGQVSTQIDLLCLSAKGLLPAYRHVCQAPSYWLMEGAHLPSYPNLSLNSAEKKPYESDLAFIGNIFHLGARPEDFNTRSRLLQKAGRNFDLKIWGIQRSPDAAKKFGKYAKVIEWPAYNEEFVKVCQSVKIVLGINLINSIELYFSNRTFLTLASGGFHLTSYVPGLETMFENHKHLVWFRDENECLELIDYYLKRPKKRQSVADAGQRLVRQRYSLSRQVGRLLNLIQKHYG